MNQASRHRPSALLHLTPDSLSNIKFLIDTGADVSIVPATASQRTLPPILHLYAANSTKIPVYSNRTLQVTSTSAIHSSGHTTLEILGADFLRHFNLLVDIKGRRLVDPLTSISSTAQPVPGDSTHLAVIHKSHQFADLLKSFPTLTQPYSASVPVKHHVTHDIETFGPPVHAKARRFAPEW